MADELQALRDSWIRDLRRTKAPRTVKAYAESVDRFIPWLRERGVTRVGKITRALVRDWLDDLLGSVSAQTTVRHYNAVRQWLSWLVSEEEITRSPADGIAQPAVPAKLMEFPDADTVRALLDTCAGRSFEDRRDAAVITLMIDTGVRASELVGIQVADLDLDASTATVMGKGRRPRLVPLGTTTVAVLDRYLRVRARRPGAS